MGAISGSYDPAAGILTLSGTATAAEYQAALRSVSFFSTSDDPTVDHTRTSRTISWQITDAGSDAAGPATSAAVTSSIRLTAINDRPVLSAGGSLAYTENGPAAAVDPALTIAGDADDTQFSAATIVIQSPVSGDVLAFSNDNASMGAISGSYDPAAGILTLSGTATAAEYQAALRSVSFFSTSDDPTADHTRTSRTISWQITDAGSDAAGTATSTAVTSSILLTAINDRPVLSAGGSLAYTENGPAAAIDPDLTITDADDTQFSAAAIAIQSPVSGDVLAFSNDNASMGAISGSYDPATGVLTLSGTATAAEYQAALRSVSFFSTSDDPTADHTRTSRTISRQITDAGSDAAGTATSAAVTSTILLTAINDRPVLSAGGSLAYTENGPAAAVDPGLSITNDADDTQLSAAAIVIQSPVSGDVLAFSNDNASMGAITGSYDPATGVLTSQAPPQPLSTRPPRAPFPSSPPATIPPSITPAHHAPSPGRSPTPAAMPQALPPVPPSPAPSASPPSTTGPFSAPVAPSPTRKTAPQRPLIQTSASPTPTTPSSAPQRSPSNPPSAEMCSPSPMTTPPWAPSAAATTPLPASSPSQAPPQPLSTRPPCAPFPSSPPATIPPSITPAPHAPSPGRSPTPAAMPRLPPVPPSPAPSSSPPSTTGPFSAPVAPSLTRKTAPQRPLIQPSPSTDADDAQLSAATIAIQSPVSTVFSNDNASMGAITGGYDPAAGILTLSGTATAAEYQAALRSVSFFSTSDDPTADHTRTSRTISWQITDAGSDAAPCHQQTVTSTILLTAINDRPVLSAGALAYTENGPAAAIDPGLTITRCRRHAVQRRSDRHPIPRQRRCARLLQRQRLHGRHQRQLRPCCRHPHPLRHRHSR